MDAKSVMPASPLYEALSAPAGDRYSDAVPFADSAPEVIAKWTLSSI
jgi:hypothetical protein